MEAILAPSMMSVSNLKHGKSFQPFNHHSFAPAMGIYFCNACKNNPRAVYQERGKVIGVWVLPQEGVAGDSSPAKQKPPPTLGFLAR